MNIDQNVKEIKNNLPEVKDYYGKPVLVLNPDAQYKFGFGLKKARLIIQNFDTIRRFVEERSEEKK